MQHIPLEGARPWVDADQQKHQLSVAGYYLTPGFLYLFVFNYEMNKLQKGIRTIFKQDQIKVRHPHPLELPSILSKGKMYSAIITLLFSLSFNIPSTALFFFFSPLPLFACLLLCLLQYELLQGPQGGI